MKDPTISAEVGDVLHGTNNRNKFRIKPHYIIYLGPDKNDEQLFFGMMLTSSPRHGNIALEARHFMQTDEAGKLYRVTFKASYVSPNLYHKKKDWQPFTKVGQLSETGLRLLRQLANGQTAKFFPFNES